VGLWPWDDSAAKLDRVHVKDGRLASAEIAEAGGGLHQIDVGGDMVRDAVREGAQGGTSSVLEILIPAKLGVEQLVGSPHRGGERHPVVVHDRLDSVVPEPGGDGGKGIFGRSGVGSQLVTRHVQAVIWVSGSRYLEHGLVQGPDTLGLLLERNTEEDGLIWGCWSEMLPALGHRSEAVHHSSRDRGSEDEKGRQRH
jgi:hypothetical protein